MSATYVLPDIPPGMYCVLQIEVCTGILLTIEGERFMGQGNCHSLFVSLDEAKRFVQQRIAVHPEWELIVLDWKQDVVETIRDEQYINSVLSPDSSPRKAGWWQRLFGIGKGKTQRGNRED